MHCCRDELTLLPGYSVYTPQHVAVAFLSCKEGAHQRLGGLKVTVLRGSMSAPAMANRVGPTRPKMTLVRASHPMRSGDIRAWFSVTFCKAACPSDTCRPVMADAKLCTLLISSIDMQRKALIGRRDHVGKHEEGEAG